MIHSAIGKGLLRQRHLTALRARTCDSARPVSPGHALPPYLGLLAATGRSGCGDHSLALGADPANIAPPRRQDAGKRNPAISPWLGAACGSARSVIPAVSMS